MDFHCLARRELQCLCKKNKIPANLTNLAMADALSALLHVEGVEELMDTSECVILQSPARASAAIPGNGTRTSARRKPIREVEVSQPFTQARVTRRTAGKCGEENKDANVPKTPAIPSSNKREPVDSACRSLESQMKEDEEEEKSVGQEKRGVPKTPAAMASSRRRAPAAASASVQRAYSTRRSVKLLETTMADLSLDDEANSKTVNIDFDEPSKDNSEVVDDEANSKTVKIDFDDPSKDNSEIVPDVLEVEEKYSKEPGMLLEETDNNSVSNDTQDKNDPDICLADNHVNDKNGADGVPATEFSSEAKNQEEAASVESNHLTPITLLDQGEYLEEIRDNQLGGDSDIKVADEEHCEYDAQIEYANEVKDDGRENSSAGLERSLGLPDGTEDSHFESGCACDEEKVECGSNVVVEKPSVESEHTLALSSDMEDSDSESECTSAETKAGDDNHKNEENQNSSEEVELLTEEKEKPSSESEHVKEVKNGMLSDKSLLEVEFDFEMEGSESEINGELFDVNVMEADVVGNLAPEQTSLVVEVSVMKEAELSDSTISSSAKLTPPSSQPLEDDVPLAAYQFPRPTQTTPMKSSTKKMAFLSDDKENNMRKADNDTDIKMKVKEIADDLTKLTLNNLSIRELKKRLKEHSKNQNGGEKKSAMVQQGGKMREPLQTLSGNQMIVAEQERN